MSIILNSVVRLLGGNVQSSSFFFFLIIIIGKRLLIHFVGKMDQNWENGSKMDQKQPVLNLLKYFSLNSA